LSLILIYANELMWGVLHYGMVKLVKYCLKFAVMGSS